MTSITTATATTAGTTLPRQWMLILLSRYATGRTWLPRSLAALTSANFAIVALGVLAPELEETVYAMSPGAVSDVVKTDFGFHIIQRVE